MDLDVELKALHANLMAIDDDDEYYVSQEQVQFLASMMNSGIQGHYTSKFKRELRLGVLDLLIGPVMLHRYGVLVESTKNITGRIANFLLDLLVDIEREEATNKVIFCELSEYGRELISACQVRVEAQLGIRQDNLI